MSENIPESEDMSLERLRVVETESPCKCCTGTGRLCGVVDFSHCGADVRAGKKVEPYAGFPIYYYRCERCGFVFTCAFDRWSDRAFAEHIYNADYVRHDPDYTGARPKANAELIASSFPEMAHGRLLDFGSGQGLLEVELKTRGFSQVASYDPYTSPADASVLSTRYQVIVAFEVFEHHPAPHELLGSLREFLDEDGAILFSTLLATDEVVDAGITKWWYCVPRNGHISFYTPKALATLALQHGLKAGSFNEGVHFFYKQSVPSWATRYSHQLW